MSEVQKSVIQYSSSNGTDTVTGYFYSAADITPKAILQISHGMCEYIGRYDDFAAFMVQQGYIVCGNDHLGHGATSDTEQGTDGYFAEKDGRKYVLQDLHTMNCTAAKKYPGLPIILLGHSMGSFFARLYAATYPQTIQALIISGTGGPNPMGGIGIVLTNILRKIKGPKYRSAFVNKLAFGAYLKRIPNSKTGYDWITRDDDIVAAYAKTPKCTFVFTVSAFNDLMQTLKAVNTTQWADKINKDMPVLLFSGAMDPVGDYGKGVQTVTNLLRGAGVHDVTLKLYEEGRHEMLNETNRKDVYQDVLAWCDAHIN